MPHSETARLPVLCTRGKPRCAPTGNTRSTAPANPGASHLQYPLHQPNGKPHRVPDSTRSTAPVTPGAPHLQYPLHRPQQPLDRRGAVC